MVGPEFHSAYVPTRKRIFYISDRPSFVHRGLLVETLYYKLRIFNIVLLWLVIFWVGYETRACARFVAILSGVRSIWPKSLLDREEVKTAYRGRISMTIWTSN
jgi:hypothetical protein